MEQIVTTLKQELSGLLARPTGSAVSLSQFGSEIWTSYTGLANLEYCLPVKPTTRFPVSSVSKQFTAMVIMLLQETGKLSYEERLGELLDGVPNYATSLTVEQLLQQVSGLPDPYNHYQEAGLNWYNLTNSMIMEFLHEQPGLKFQPGEQFDYCNSNYVLLAMLAERVEDKPFGDILSDLVFRPLAMDASLLYTERFVIPERAYGYQQTEHGKRTIDCQWLSYGDGGIISSIPDLGKWAAALLQHKLVKQETLYQALSSGRTNDGKETGYGYGWMIKQLGKHRCATHFGGDPGFGSVIMLVPDLQLSLVMLSNLDESWRDMSRAIAAIQQLIAGI